MLNNCKGCYQTKEMYKGKLCRECHNSIEKRRYLENKLKNESWRYVECGGDDCLNIWRLKKKKLIKGKINGLSFELYERSKCPKCNSTAICFLNGGKIKGVKK